MNWDLPSVTYSSQEVPDAESVASSSVGRANQLQRKIAAKFRQFLREWRADRTAETFEYRDRLQANYDQKEWKLVVDFNHISKFDPNLGEELRCRPQVTLDIFERSAKEVVAMNMVPRPALDDMNDVQIQLKNYNRNAIHIRDLGSSNMNQLVCVPGIVISASRVETKATRMTIQCSSCRATKQIYCNPGMGNASIPRTCEFSSADKNEKRCPLDPFVVVPDRCDFVDIQSLRLQEDPENIPTGEMPRRIKLSCDRKLVDRVKPGARINAIAVYSTIPAKKRGKDKGDASGMGVQIPYLRVIGLEEVNATKKKGQVLPEEEEAIRELARDPNLYENLAKSIAPAIYGYEDIKKAVCVLMFGGTRKHLPGGARLRGDINVLLLGDPSCAKSAFLKFVHEIAPVAVYTSGKGSSAAGLTASVMRDPASGEFHLEGGAMVLADGGVVCIDEFDKMREQDRVAIHEAMEQQTISIAKAGITTILNSRTSVLAAANPIYGRYDIDKTTAENIDFQSTILSRFDLIFIIRDIKDLGKDKTLADHIIKLHINMGMETAAQEGPISTDDMSKLVAFARHNVHPKLSVPAAEHLRNHYVRFRKEAKTRRDTSAIPITVRQLEAIVRISESLAKMELKDEATVDHVKEAVRLFQVATLAAAQTGEMGMGGANSPEFTEKVVRAEKYIQQRVMIGEAKQVSKLSKEATSRTGLDERAVLAAITVMVRRGDLEFKNKRKKVYRRR